MTQIITIYQQYGLRFCGKNYSFFVTNIIKSDLNIIINLKIIDKLVDCLGRMVAKTYFIVFGLLLYINLLKYFTWIK